MSLSFGGLGLMSLRHPFTELVGMVFGKADLKSVLCLVVFCIVISVLAYLTNPTENSFRAYLTEQSFRQHLSRLDNVDDDHKEQDNSGSRHTPKRSTFVSSHAHSLDSSSTFHFANRASVSLRTPKHAFRSFGLFTIAAMMPLPRSTGTDQRDFLMICDSWYLGAFGRWWRGGIIETWYQDVIARSKDEESWSSGILSMKNLDMLNDYNGLPFSTKNLPPHHLSRGSPPKLRNRERSSQRPTLLPPRSSTPPPLPKSASLPFHTARLPSLAHIDLPSSNSTPPSLHNIQCRTTDSVCSGSPIPSRLPPTLFEQSPRIAEVIRQISHSKCTVLELRNQLSETQSSSSQSHAALQGEVDSLRERKRQEDASKLEIKSRTKALDDSKRNAETLKKDAEKKLKAAQNLRDDAAQRIDHLDKEIAILQQRLIDDEALICQSGNIVSDAEKELLEALERKRQEIKVTEDVVTALNRRARELEEKLSEEKYRLEALKENLRIRQLEQTLRQDPVTSHLEPSIPWKSTIKDIHDPLSGSSIPEFQERHRSLVGFEAINSLDRRPSISRDLQVLSGPSPIPPGNVFNIKKSPRPGYSPTGITQAVLRANGYTVFDDGVLSTSPPQIHYHQNSAAFSPFGGTDHDVPISLPVQSLVPSTLDSTGGLPRSFQSESDVFMDRDWRTNIVPYGPQGNTRIIDNPEPSMTASPTLYGPRNYEHGPVEARFVSSGDNYGRDREIRHHHTQDIPMDMRHVHHRGSDPSYNRIVSEEIDPPSSTESPGRWFPTASKDKPKKGLNPDAKVFSFHRKSPSSVTPYDALNPNGLSSPSSVPPSTSTNNSLLRAFAPSRAEREALQRALGGSSNASFELLPSLSDVGSIPSSPVHVHATDSSQVVAPHSAQEMAKGLPSWLQSLPRIRKPNFSPWEDEEPALW